MNEQDLPMLLHRTHQTFPIDFLILEQYQVCNIGSIVAATILDEDLGPDQIRDGWNLDVVIENPCGVGVLEPIVRYGSNQVGRTKDEIGVQFSFENFRNPAFVVNLSLETESCKSIQDFGVIAGLNENVDILCRTSQARVVIDRKSPGDHESEFGFFKDFQNFSVEGVSRGVRRLPLHNLSIEKVTTIQGIYRAGGVCLISLIALTGQAQLCKEWNRAVKIGTLDAQLKEASGIAASRNFPGRLYHINDSGDTGRFYVTDMQGKNTQPVSVAGWNPQDTEALSLGPCPGDAGKASCLYFGDIGDNDKKRNSIEIVVVDEVKSFPKKVNARSRMKLRYPDGAHDAESLAVHPSGTIYILTKERPAHLFRVDGQTLTPVATLDPGGAPTDMAISDDGSRLLVLTYTDAVEYSMDLKEQQKIRLDFLQQQESVTYLPGSRSFIYSTERLVRVLPQWIMRADCKL